MNKNIPFRLFANCIPVYGKKRSTICDIQRHDITLIPNDLYNIIEKYEGKSILFICKEYKNEFDNIILEYFDFLIEKEYIFFTENPFFFPKISTNWDDPALINNAIIEIKNDLKYSINDIINSLNKMNCRHLELRCYDALEVLPITHLLNYIKDLESSILSINIMLPFINKKEIDLLINFSNNYKRIIYLVVYDSKKNKYKKFQKNEGYIYYTEKKITSNVHCGIISEKLFVINTKSFTESINHNSCLNKKISIDVNGNIKNCPSMLESYGNVKNTTLEQALNHNDFKKYWNITKNKIDICNDCEFRYVCTDCRAYIEKPKDIYSKPLKCGYSPYTNEWEEWSTNPLKQKSIKFYGMEKLIKIN